MADYLMTHDESGTASLVPLDRDDPNMYGALVDGVYVPIDPAEMVECWGCQ